MLQDRTDYNIFGISHQKGLQNGVKFHTHFQYEIFVFYNGHVKYAIGNNMYELQPGDIVVLDGSLMHRPFIFSDERFYERSVVQFSSEWIYPVLKSLNSDHVFDIFEKNHFAILRSENSIETEVLDQHIQSIEAYIRDFNLSEVEAEIQIELVYLLIKLNKYFKTVESSKTSQLGEKYEYVQAAVQYVQNNYQESFNLDQVAEELNISKSYLVHLFKDLTGNSVMDYAMNYRLKQAMHMLAAYPHMKNKEVCYNCGFQNESHFSRYFKKHIGQTPGEFKKRYV